MTFLLLAAGVVHGQAPLISRTLDSATVVRLHFRNDGMGEGRLLSPLGPSSPSVRYCSLVAPRCAPGQETVVAMGGVSQVDVQSGTRTIRGFLIGTAIASVVVIPLIEISGSFTQGSTRASLFVKGFALSALIGGSLGALAGHAHRTWVPAP